MPSLRTRIAYQAIVLDTAGEAIADAAVALSEASAGLETVTGDLVELASGNLDLEAITVNGVRFVNNGGILEAE